MVRTQTRLRFVVEVLISGLLCGTWLGGCQGGTTDKDVELISVAEARRLIRAAKIGGEKSTLLVVDPRPSAQFSAGHIPGARNVGLAQVNERRKDPTLTRYDKFLVYGSDPGSAVAVGMCKRLIEAEYGEVLLLQGGLLAWRGQGGEVEATKEVSAGN